MRISCCRESKCNAPKKYRWNQQILLQQQKMDDQRESIANLPSLLLPKGLPSSNTKEKALDIDNRWKVLTLVKIYFFGFTCKDSTNFYTFTRNYAIAKSELYRFVGRNRVEVEWIGIQACSKIYYVSQYVIEEFSSLQRLTERPSRSRQTVQKWLLSNFLLNSAL